MEGKTQQASAASAAMSERSARKWQRGSLPSESKKARRRWRSRPDPFADVWESDVVPLLRTDPDGELSATTILEWLDERHPGRFGRSQLRTLQRRIRDYSRDHRVVRAPMPRAMSGVDPGLGALEAAARRPPPGPPVDACGPDAGLMARAVGPAVGGDSASDATAAGPAHASGLSLAPVARDRDAEVRTVPRPVARHWLPADPAREARQAVVHPAARQARGFLELD